MNKSRMIVVLIGGLATFGSGNGALALDLRDRVITFDTAATGDSRDLITGEVKKGAFETKKSFDLVAGQIVSFVAGSACRKSLIYKPGQPVAETVTCKPNRGGTDSNYIEFNSSADFMTQSSVAGNILILRGEMTVVDKMDQNRCNREKVQEISRYKIIESARIQIVGETCRVLEYKSTSEGEITKTSSEGSNSRKFGRTTIIPKRVPSCKITRRADQPPPDAPLQPVPFGCTSGRTIEKHEANA